MSRRRAPISPLTLRVVVSVLVGFVGLLLLTDQNRSQPTENKVAPAAIDGSVYTTPTYRRPTTVSPPTTDPAWVEPTTDAETPSDNSLGHDTNLPYVPEPYVPNVDHHHSHVSVSHGHVHFHL